MLFNSGLCSKIQRDSAILKSDLWEALNKILKPSSLIKWSGIFSNYGETWICYLHAWPLREPFMLRYSAFKIPNGGANIPDIAVGTTIVIHNI